MEVSEAIITDFSFEDFLNIKIANKAIKYEVKDMEITHKIYNDPYKWLDVIKIMSKYYHIESRDSSYRKSIGYFVPAKSEVLEVYLSTIISTGDPIFDPLKSIQGCKDFVATISSNTNSADTSQQTVSPEP